MEFETPELIVLIFIGIFGIIILGITCFWIRKRCRKYDELPDASVGSNKLWVGSDPTNLAPPAPVKKKIDIGARDARHRENLRVSGNFCRSTTHQRSITQPIPRAGWRKSKYFCIITDDAVNKYQGRVVNALMTMHHVKEDSLIDIYASSKTPKAFVALFKAIKHPYVLNTIDVGYSIDKKAVFFVRPFAMSGSLKDFIVQNKDPANDYDLKYPKSVLSSSRSSHVPIRLPLIQKYGRQILEGLKYFNKLGFPYHHLHSGNVVVFEGQCKLTDYENSFFGFKNRIYKKIKNHYNPQLAAFGCILYEMASGGLIPLKGKVSLHIEKRGYEIINDLLNYIFKPHPKKPVTLDDLLAEEFFDVQVNIMRTPKVDRADLILSQDRRIQNILERITTHYTEVVWKKNEKKSNGSDDEERRSKKKKKKSKKKKKKRKAAVESISMDIHRDSLADSESMTQVVDLSDNEADFINGSSSNSEIDPDDVLF